MSRFSQLDVSSLKLAPSATAISTRPAPEIRVLLGVRVVHGRLGAPAMRRHALDVATRRRIVSSPSSSALLSTAFVNPEGRLAVVVMTPIDQAVAYFLWLAGNAAEVKSLPHSIQTLVF